MKSILVISGPTAVGKTALSIRLGHQLNEQHGISVEIVNFDSLLFYRELSIGTAKPTVEEMKGIPHHLVGNTSIATPFNAADFVQKANTLLNDIHQRGHLPILVGGSGFYLRALVKGMWDMKTTNPDIRCWVRTQYQQWGITPLIEILKKRDPQSLQTIHPNDHYRLGRACEYALETGEPISNQKHFQADENPFDFSHHAHPDTHFIHLHLEVDKECHQQYIHHRTQKMIQSGLIEEIRQLLANGFSTKEKPLQSIGYKEGIDYLQGRIATTEELTEKIVISTRQLAKSQRTFFKKISPKKVLEERQWDNIASQILPELCCNIEERV